MCFLFLLYLAFASLVHTQIDSESRVHTKASPGSRCVRHISIMINKFSLTHTSQCARLQYEFGSSAHDRIAFRNTTAFNSQQSGRAGYWTQQEASVIPRCRFTPTCAEDVALAVSTLSQCNCLFAIRGGGHMSWAGAANIQDGVAIDLSLMNSVEVSEDRHTTSVGPGARWHHVYNKLDSLGLSVVGGRVSDVGVAGVTLGGIEFLGCDIVHRH